MTKQEFNKELEDKLKELKAKKEELEAWIYDPVNINDPQWREKKMEYNCVCFKIDFKQNQIKGFSSRDRVNEVRVGTLA